LNLEIVRCEHDLYGTSTDPWIRRLCSWTTSTFFHSARNKWLVYRHALQPAMPEEMVVVMELAWNHDPEKRPDASALRKLLEEVNRSTVVTKERSKSSSVLKSRA
ncbi:hypothetical protein COOONC_11758, partial [Cooperia oncophora]